MSMPQGGGSGQSWEAGSEPGSGTGPGGGPQGQPHEQPPYGQQAQYGQPQYGQGAHGQQPPAYGGGGPAEGRPISPVNEIDTRVTGRRIVQYIVDGILTYIGFALLSWAGDQGHGGIHTLLVLVTALAAIAWFFLYWSYVPYVRNGQTFGMTLLGIRVISKDGSAASLGQLFVRSLPLIPAVVFLSLLIGIITMMCSRYRQRVFDHIARTLVVSTRVMSAPARPEFAGAGQAGSR
jgi:uncharacterized RDD family membrane protein YckC